MPRRRRPGEFDRGGGDGELLVFPHSGVFWPQDPAATFLYPVAVAKGVKRFDVIG
ncbi:hypothetical protein AB0K60_13660 [Thermopolyspora sp. NPDC052614]|uniref:hypothetical protein n=1 Tax=Thermopolyspora sp. NPDC052614 TaxID=3155682 RepID=UPI00341DAE57